MDDYYSKSEAPVGLLCLPDTTANILTSVLGYSYSLQSAPCLCRGQAYVGAANMQGKCKGFFKHNDTEAEF